MTEFEQFIQNFIPSQPQELALYHHLGKTYPADTKDFQGYYWFYETEDFVIDIHNLLFKHDLVDHAEYYNFEQSIDLSICFVISGNGELFNPYQVIEPFSVFILDPKDKKNRYLMHQNSKFFAVGIKFKHNFLEQFFQQHSLGVKNIDLTKTLYTAKEIITKPLSQLAMEILQCQLSTEEAKTFFYDKAQQWLTISLTAYKELQNIKPLAPEDEVLIENVAQYLNDHYATEVPQKLLEQIACMSGTKLKESFKKKYHISITEFVQRKRMNIAEQLLLNTDLQIKYIAKTVGYNSLSRFSSLYKRYKGTLPRDSKI